MKNKEAYDSDKVSEEIQTSANLCLMFLRPQTQPKSVQTFVQQDMSEQEPTESTQILQREDSTNLITRLEEHGILKYSAMISYSKDNKELIDNISARLKEKSITATLLNDKPIAPNSLEVIKSQIRNTEFILICFSESYKRSMLCRLAAFYAKSLSKKLLFVRVQSGYVPTDWLGDLIGSSQYFDLFGELFDANLRKIVASIKGLPNEDDEPQCKGWTEREVLEWATENQIDFLQQEYALF